LRLLFDQLGPIKQRSWHTGGNEGLDLAFAALAKTTAAAAEARNAFLCAASSA
jgi:hypothetical protein